MKEVQVANITFEDVVEEYTILNKGDSVIFSIKPDQKFKLICMNFNGNEELVRIDWQRDVLTCTAFYKDGKHFTWNRGSSTTLCDKKYFEQMNFVQALAEKVTKLSYDRYAKRR